MEGSAGSSTGTSQGAASGEGAGQSQQNQGTQAAKAGETALAADQQAAPEPTQEGEAKETKETKEVTPEKKPYRWADRLSKEYPDRKYESDDDYDTAMDEYLGELEGYRERGRLANQKLIGLFDTEPVVGSIVRDMLEGSSARSALARHFAPEDLVPQDGDDDIEAWKKNKAEREDRLAKRKKRDEDYANNTKATQAAIEEFVTENGMDDAAAGEFLSYIDTHIGDVMNGKLSKDLLSMFHKARNYEAEVAKARETGEIAGQNKKIVAEKEKEPVGDGLPKPKNTGSGPDQPQRQQSWIDGLRDAAKKREIV